MVTPFEQNFHFAIAETDDWTTFYKRRADELVHDDDDEKVTKLRPNLLDINVSAFIDCIPSVDYQTTRCGGYTL